MVVPGEIVITEIMYNPDGPTLGEDDLFEGNFILEPRAEICKQHMEVYPVQFELYTFP